MVGRLIRPCVKEQNGQAVERSGIHGRGRGRAARDASRRKRCADRPEEETLATAGNIEALRAEGRLQGSFVARPGRGRERASAPKRRSPRGRAIRGAPNWPRMLPVFDSLAARSRPSQRRKPRGVEGASGGCGAEDRRNPESVQERDRHIAPEVGDRFDPQDPQANVRGSPARHEGRRHHPGRRRGLTCSRGLLRPARSEQLHRGGLDRPAAVFPTCSHLRTRRGCRNKAGPLADHKSFRSGLRDGPLSRSTDRDLVAGSGLEQDGRADLHPPRPPQRRVSCRDSKAAVV